MMEKEVGAFGQRFGLSVREKEVLQLLAHQVISLKDIAARLKLSPNTVNNHLKSIFEKTQTSGRAGLLAALLNDAYDQQDRACGRIHRRPHILVVDDEPEICALFEEELSMHGMRVSAFTNPTEALAAIPFLKVDVVISDITMPGLSGIQILEKLRTLHTRWPAVVLMTGFAAAPEYELHDLGAVALLEKPLNLRKVIRLIREQIIDAPLERIQAFDLTKQSPTQIMEVISLGVEQIGHGGAFLSVESLAAVPKALRREFKPGRVVKFRFRAPQIEGEMAVHGEIVWMRDGATDGLDAGIGVKFIDLSEEDVERFRPLLQARSSRSFIPKGVAGAKELSAPAPVSRGGDFAGLT